MQTEAQQLVGKLQATLKLASIMPPSKLKKNLIGLINLAPQIEDNLLEKIQLPMEIDNSDPNNPFLKTEFNRQGNSYRSPYTNNYSPPVDGYKPSGPFRVLQQTGAVLFSEYIKLYYGNDTVGNFYVLENQQNKQAFSCGFFAKKHCDQSDGFKGSWDSFNIVDVTWSGSTAHYTLNSTILLQMDITENGTNLSGFLKKQKQQSMTFNQGASQSDIFGQHLVIIGEMIEDMQTLLRQHLEAVYIAKTKEIIFTTRYQHTIKHEQDRQSLANDLRKLRFKE